MSVEQRFNWYSTAEDVLKGCDLSGKTFFVTGSTSGIGFEAARNLAVSGAEVIISGSSSRTCNDAVEKIQQEKPEAKVDSFPINLKSLTEVRRVASEISKKYSNLDGIILNAGALLWNCQQTEDDLETVFQVNHLSQFYLTLLLESLLKNGSRIVIISSSTHKLSTLGEHNMNIERLSRSSSSLYFGLIAYGDSKLCNIFFGIELKKRLAQRGVDIMVLHPGDLMYTSLARSSLLYRAFFIMCRPFTKSLQQGAATTVYCATAPELTGHSGHFYESCYISSTSAKGTNEKMASALWDVSVAALKTRGFDLPENVI